MTPPPGPAGAIACAPATYITVITNANSRWLEGFAGKTADVRTADAKICKYQQPRIEVHK